MLTLGIDTATTWGGVALVRDGAVIAERAIESSREHSRLIPTAIADVLGEARATIAEVDVVAVSRGPGSFTGIRVGMALAKALCEPGTPRLVVVSSLGALAQGAYQGEAVEYVAALLDARRGEIYGLFAPVRDGRVEVDAAEEFCASPADVIARWPGRCLVAGEATRTYAEAFAPVITRGEFLLAGDPHANPRPGALTLLGERLAFAGVFADPATAGPVYLREAAVSEPRRRPAGDPG